MNERYRTRLGTISIWLALVPILALISWFVFYRPCGSLLRAFIEDTVLWGTAVSFLFSIAAVFKDKPKKRELIGLALSSLPLICFITIVAAIVYSIATGSTGIPGKLDLIYSGSTGTPAMLEPGVFITTETKYYDVIGSTENELNAQVVSLGPDGLAARTFPFYRWNYIYKEKEGSCRIERVRIATLITFTYPRWNDTNTGPELREWWGRNLASVEEHESVHEGTARKASLDMYDSLNRLPPYPSCNELKQAIDTTAQSVIEEAKKIDQEFDRVTDHGRLQAVKNP